MAKINLVKAITIYEEEKAWKAELEQEFQKQKEITATAGYGDPFWDHWYEVSAIFEPENDKDKEDVKADNDDSEDDGFDLMDDLFKIFYDDEGEPHQPSKPNRYTRRARRRQQRYHYKRRMRRNVKDMLNGYLKRTEEDMRNLSYCKRRGGHYVSNPKSRSMRTDRLYKSALKRKVVSEP